MEVIVNPSQPIGFLSGVSQFFGSLFLLTFQLIGVIILIYIVNKIVSKLFFHRQVHKRLSDDDYLYLLVKTSSDNEQKEIAMEDFLRSLHRILPNNTHFSLEMTSSEQFLSFYIVVPSTYKNAIESQLYAQYPNAEVEIVKDYLPPLETAAFAEIFADNAPKLAPPVAAACAICEAACSTA